MKKIIIAIVLAALLLSSFVFAQSNTTSLPPLPKASEGQAQPSTPGRFDNLFRRPPPRVVDAACMQAATEKRDSMISGAVDFYGTTVKSALTARTSALKTAWGVADAKNRREALRLAWEKFKGTWRTALGGLRDAKNSAWKQFYADRKVCGAEGASDDSTTAAVDVGL